MKPKEKRDRLFKSSRPHVRPLELFDNGKYSKDLAILWAAYKKGSFPEMPEMDQSEFTEFILDIASQYSKGWMIEDNNSQYKDGHGAIGFMFAADNGWEVEPHFESFEWATPRNILRSVVSFLQMMRYSKDVGVVNIYSLSDSKKFYDHLIGYGVTRYVGKVPHGDIRGDRYIYYTRGKNERPS